MARQPTSPPTAQVQTPQPATSADIEALKDTLRTTSEQFGLDPDLLQALVEKESRFNPNAVSPRGARGPMQIMPKTAEELRTRYGDDHITQGVGYFKELLERFENDIPSALAAYNAGPGRLERARRLAALRGTDWMEWVPPETQQYVRDVLSAYEQRKRAVSQAPAVGALSVDPRAAKLAVEYGITSINTLDKIPGFSSLSLEGKKQVAQRFGYDVSGIPDDMLATLFSGGEPAILAMPPSRGGAATFPLPGAVATAVESRIVDPIKAAFRGDSSLLERGLALGEIAGAVAAPEFAAASIGAQSVVNWMLGDNDIAPFVGSLVEMGGSLTAWTRAGRRGRQGVRTLQKGLEAAAQGGMTAEEVIGAQMRRALRTRLGRVKTAVSGERRAAEQYLSTNPQWVTDTTLGEYTALLDGVEGLWRDQIINDVPPSIAGPLTTLREQLMNHERIPLNDLYRFRETLRRQAAFVDTKAVSGNPPGNRAVLAYLGQLRARLDDVIHESLRAEGSPNARNTIQHLSRADALHQKYVAPAFTFLRAALSTKSTPTQAYRALFGMRDQQALRTAVNLLGNSAFAGVRDKIRLGFAKYLADSTQDFADIPKVIRILKNQEEFLSAHNIFTQREIRDMQVFFRKRNLTSLRSLFQRDLSATSALGVSAAAGLTAASIGARPLLPARNIETGRYEYQPRSLMVAAMVTGTTPLLLRLGVRPHDPQASTKAAMQLIGGFSAILRRIAYTNVVGEEAVQHLDDDAKP